MGNAFDAHMQAGRHLRVGGLQSFVLDHGDGEPVVCMHGVPVSSYVYRKLLGELGSRGMRGIAFDLPGCGLADRPASYDYSWTGLGRFAVQAVDALELERFHLVVHDIGGPVGFELLAAMPERVESVTILDTLVRVSRFSKPWMMWPFEKPLLGELWLASMIPPAFLALMYRVGVSDRTVAPPEELKVHLDLLKRDDGGRAFLQIMRSFETTEAKERLYLEALGRESLPKQAIWGRDDTALRLKVQGADVREIVGDERFTAIEGKHFVQETAAPAIADRIVEQARR